MDTTPNPRGLAGLTVGETAISSLAEGQQYRGYRFQDLADQVSFEEVTFLLLYGELPRRVELESYRQQLTSEASLPRPLLDAIRHLPTKAHVNEVFRFGVSYLACSDDEVDDDSPDANRRKACRLIARAPLIVAAWHRLRAGLEPLRPQASWSYPQNVLWLFRGEPPCELHTRALGQSLIVYAENEFNTSTFAVRVVRSTLADLYAAVTAALAAHKGPLHGGASEQVMQVLLEVGTPARAVPWLQQALAQRRKVMGFGHRVFTEGDPRAHYLKPICQELGAPRATRLGRRWQRRSSRSWRREKRLFPNVDWATARLYHYVGVPLEMYTPLFAISRLAGWCRTPSSKHRTIASSALGLNTRVHPPGRSCRSTHGANDRHVLRWFCLVLALIRVNERFGSGGAAAWLCAVVLSIPARPMARSRAMRPVEVPETTNQPGRIGRAGINR